MKMNKTLKIGSLLLTFEGEPWVNIHVLPDFHISFSVFIGIVVFIWSSWGYTCEFKICI